jgi:leucyl aminopeptidase
MAEKIEVLTRDANGATPLHAVSKDKLADWLAGQSAQAKTWIEATGFEGASGKTCLVPGSDGKPTAALIGTSATDGMWSFGNGARDLPRGTYKLATTLSGEEATRAALAWGLGAYSFGRYKETEAARAKLVWPDAADEGECRAMLDGIVMARDLINTPTEDMGPSALAEAGRDLARRHNAKFNVIVGDDLLKQNYPSIHAIGRASDEEPRLIDIVWGDEKAPKVTLCGKGVCFDTGGLDIKPASGMKLMKKDMGGGANIMALAHIIMATGLNVRLRVLVPAVENAISGNAVRPLDVIRARSGKTIEIGNTDAEGRVILADALAEACREQPDLLLDFATLTGAARVALGADLPALFSNDDALANDLLAAGTKEQDPMWRLPLWPGYRRQIEGKTGDITNAPDTPMGGAITAALFLQEFVTSGIKWAHVDMLAWNQSNRSGRPEGGEAQAVRACYALLKRRYGN